MNHPTEVSLTLVAVMVFGIMTGCKTYQSRQRSRAPREAATVELRLVEIRSPEWPFKYQWAAPGDLLILSIDSYPWPPLLYRYQGEPVLAWDVRSRVITVNGKKVGLDLRGLRPEAAKTLVQKHRRGGPLFLWEGKVRIPDAGIRRLATMSDSQRVRALAECGYGIRLRHVIEFLGEIKFVLTNCPGPKVPSDQVRDLLNRYPSSVVKDSHPKRWRVLARRPDLRFLTTWIDPRWSKADLMQLQARRSMAQRYLTNARSNPGQYMDLKNLEELVGLLSFFMERARTAQRNTAVPGHTKRRNLPDSLQARLKRLKRAVPCAAVNIHRAGPTGLRKLQHVTSVCGMLSSRDYAYLAQLPHLRVVRFYDVGFLTDDELGKLASRPKGLWELTINTSKTLPELRSFRHLRAMRELRVLDVGQSPNAVLKHVGELKELQTLAVRTHRTVYQKPRIESKSLANLRRLSKLQRLVIELDERQLAQLASLTTLRALELSIHGEEGALQHLGGLHRLQYLLLRIDKNYPVDQLKHLAGLKNLQYLMLGSLKLFGPKLNLQHLSRFTNLRFLGFGHRVHVSDSDLKHFASLKNLRSLYLEHTDITGAGLAELSSLDQLQVLALPKLSRNAQAHLLRLKGLRWVSVRSREDRSRLRRWLKKVRPDVQVRE